MIASSDSREGITETNLRICLQTVGSPFQLAISITDFRADPANDGKEPRRRRGGLGAHQVRTRTQDLRRLRGLRPVTSARRADRVGRRPAGQHQEPAWRRFLATERGLGRSQAFSLASIAVDYRIAEAVVLTQVPRACSCSRSFGTLTGCRVRPDGSRPRAP